uniref:monocarboxylate transporter 14-like n=1 Tax=Macaca mulatta TaxID=9544 RepID=UPI0010A1FA50|nr:monocarboxylate transporter 14-like [Macaca mulatta]
MRPLPSGKNPNDPGEKDLRILPAHSTEYVMSNGQQGRTGEKDGGSGNEETLCDLQAQECPIRPDHGLSPVLKNVSWLTMRVKKDSEDWYSGYFGTASLFTNRMFVAFIFWASFAYSSFVISFIHLPEIVSLCNLLEQATFSL